MYKEYMQETVKFLALFIIFLLIITLFQSIMVGRHDPFGLFWVEKYVLDTSNCK